MGKKWLGGGWGDFPKFPKSWLKCLREGFTGAEQEVKLHRDNLLLHLWGTVKTRQKCPFPSRIKWCAGQHLSRIVHGECMRNHPFAWHFLSQAGERDAKCHYRFPPDTVLEIVQINSAFKWNHSDSVHRNVNERCHHGLFALLVF